MIIHATRAESARSRRHYVSPQGTEADVETYMGMNKALLGDALHNTVGDALSPNAYRVCQVAGAVLHPHYHQADQFQVFVSGSGRIGTHAVEAVTVHFASAFSPYGPIVAGPAGLEYLTLRRRFDPGAQWMPDAAPRLRELSGRVHRSHTSGLVATCAPTTPADGQSLVTALMEYTVAEALLVDLGSAASWCPTAAADSFLYVLSGTVDVAGQSLPAESCLFASREENPLRLSTGAGAARLLLARFLVEEKGP